MPYTIHDLSNDNTKSIKTVSRDKRHTGKYQNGFLQNVFVLNPHIVNIGDGLKTQIKAPVLQQTVAELAAFRVGTQDTKTMFLPLIAVLFFIETNTASKLFTWF